MKPATFRTLLALSAVCTGASAAPAPPAADPSLTEIRSLSATLTQGRACKWLLPFDEVALQGKIADDAARVTLNSGAKAGEAADAAAKRMFTPAACNSDSDRQAQAQTALVRLEWLARADAIYSVSEAAPYAKGMTTLGASNVLRRQELERMRAAFIKNAGAAAWEPMNADITAEAQSIVALACRDRAKFNSKTPRKCPAPAKDMAKFRSLAVAELKSAESFVTAYEAAEKALAASTVAAASDRSRLWRAMESNLDASLVAGVACNPGDAVVDFNGPRAERAKDATGKDIVVAPVIAFGNPVEIGKVTAAPDGTNYVLVQADTKAAAAGLQGRVLFKRCSPA